MLLERLCEFAIIPKRIFLGPLESVPHSYADFSFTKVAENRASIVDFIREGHQKNVLVNEAEVINVARFAGEPIFLELTSYPRADDRIRVGANDIRNSIAEGDSNALASPRHDRKRPLLAQCDNAHQSYSASVP
jgi:hypothetical protein